MFSWLCTRARLHDHEVICVLHPFIQGQRVVLDPNKTKGFSIRFWTEHYRRDPAGCLGLLFKPQVRFLLCCIRVFRRSLYE